MVLRISGHCIILGYHSSNGLIKQIDILKGNQRYETPGIYNKKNIIKKLLLLNNNIRRSYIHEEVRTIYIHLTLYLIINNDIKIWMILSS